MFAKEIILKIFIEYFAILTNNNWEQDESDDFPTCNEIFSKGITPKPGVNCIHTVNGNCSNFVYS